jgi:metal-responsive CopG/Arc/MetJ family transcriptional regulator
MRRTTVALPADLLDAADRAVRAGKAESRADLLSRGLRRELAARRRAEIDAAFLEMASDPEYQAEALGTAEEAVAAGWEALRIGGRRRAKR